MFASESTTNLVPRAVGVVTEIQTGGFSDTISKCRVLETICRQRDETISYCGMFTPHLGSWLLFLYRILRAALKASVANKNCF